MNRYVVSCVREIIICFQIPVMQSEPVHFLFTIFCVCVSPIQFSWAEYQYSYKYWSTAALSSLPLFMFSSSWLALLRKKSGGTRTSQKSSCSTGVYLPSTNTVKCRCGKKHAGRLHMWEKGCCLHLLGCEMRCWILSVPFLLFGFCG